MASPISLEGSIRTCKVDTALANKIQSDRFLNPNNMVCPIWNGVDTAGRAVCPDSFYTKSIGCNSAEDRVEVENGLRPRYAEYISLSARGIEGDSANYGARRCSTAACSDSNRRTADIDDSYRVTGNFGLNFGADIRTNCSAFPYDEAMVRKNQQLRGQQAAFQGMQSNNMRASGGY